MVELGRVDQADRRCARGRASCGRDVPVRRVQARLRARGKGLLGLAAGEVGGPRRGGLGRLEDALERGRDIRLLD
eukprot:9203294-Alexandrium_andersonii.AAC.1